jgi:hypothetical protein
MPVEHLTWECCQLLDECRCDWHLRFIEQGNLNAVDQTDLNGVS